MLWALQLNEASEQYNMLEERVEYIRSLHELIRNHFSIFSTENEALDISVRRQFQRSLMPPRPPPPHLLCLTVLCLSHSSWMCGRHFNLRKARPQSSCSASDMPLCPS